MVRGSMTPPVTAPATATPPPTYVVDESLAAGQKKQVEWAKPGMTVTVQRTIVENGTTHTDTLTSRYVPWRAQYLVAPGTDIPATPTAEPGATAEATKDATDQATNEATVEPTSEGASEVTPEVTPTP